MLGDPVLAVVRQGSVSDRVVVLVRWVPPVQGPAVHHRRVGRLAIRVRRPQPVAEVDDHVRALDRREDVLGRRVGGVGASHLGAARLGGDGRRLGKVEIGRRQLRPHRPDDHGDARRCGLVRGGGRGERQPAREEHGKEYLERESRDATEQ